jgi:2-phosphosulfolactate phosphatase
MPPKLELPGHRSLALDVALAPALLPAHKAHHARTTYIVVDVIRATTTLSVLFDHGCRRVLVAPGISAARAARAALPPTTLLAGESGGLRPEGFDLGNSPAECAAAPVGGRDIIFATTNGTRALRACLGGHAIFAGALRNAHAVARAALHAALPAMMDAASGAPGPGSSPKAMTAGAAASEAALHEPAPDIVVVCSGRGDRPAYDDTICAGYLVAQLMHLATQAGLGVLVHEGARIAEGLAGRFTDAESRLRALAASDAAQATMRVGLADDLPWCAAVDASGAVPAVVGSLAGHDLLILENATTEHS